MNQLMIVPICEIVVKHHTLLFEILQTSFVVLL